MKDPQSQDLTIMAFGALFFLCGLVLTARAWAMGHRWPTPGTDASADRIDGTANLRLGAAALLGGACMAIAGALLAAAPKTALNGLTGVAVMVVTLGILVVVVMLMRACLKLSARAASVRVRDSLPKRPRWYLVWSPPPDDHPSPN
ncbi:MAG TPA: hypothetical protein VGH44_03775 [Candidatus Saccharimonadia bacterium]